MCERSSGDSHDIGGILTLLRDMFEAANLDETKQMLKRFQHKRTRDMWTIKMHPSELAAIQNDHEAYVADLLATNVFQTMADDEIVVV